MSSFSELPWYGGSKCVLTLATDMLSIIVGKELGSDFISICQEAPGVV